MMFNWIVLLALFVLFAHLVNELVNGFREELYVRHKPNQTTQGTQTAQTAMKEDEICQIRTQLMTDLYKGTLEDCRTGDFVFEQFDLSGPFMNDDVKRKFTQTATMLADKSTIYLLSRYAKLCQACNFIYTCRYEEHHLLTLDDDIIQTMRLVLCYHTTIMKKCEEDPARSEIYNACLDLWPESMWWMTQQEMNFLRT